MNLLAKTQYLLSFALCILLPSLLFAADAGRVNLEGYITTQDGTPVCAMALASGQYMFSCNPAGYFTLENLPTESDGSVNLQVFAQGFSSYISKLYEFGYQSITLETSGYCYYNEPSPQNTDKGYSRQNPAEIGTRLVHEEFGDYSLGDYTVRATLLRIFRGPDAWELIYDASSYNDEPSAGREYILAEIRFEFLESTEDVQYDIDYYDFDAVSSSGVDYDTTFISLPEPELEATMYQGGSVQGWTVFEVEIGDSSPLMTFGRDYNGVGGVWFKLY